MPATGSQGCQQLCVIMSPVGHTNEDAHCRTLSPWKQDVTVHNGQNVGSPLPGYIIKFNTRVRGGIIKLKYLMKNIKSYKHLWLHLNTDAGVLHHPAHPLKLQ